MFEPSTPRTDRDDERSRISRATLPACLIAAFALISGAVWPATIDVGRKGQQANGGLFRITLLDSLVFEDTAGAPGDPAEDVLERIRAKIDAHPSFTAVTLNDGGDPGRNAILVLRIGLVPDPVEPYSVAVMETDPNVSGAAIWYVPTDPRDKLTYQEVSAVNADGSITLEVACINAGLLSHTVSTAGKTPAQVNADLQSALAGNGFTLNVSGSTVEASLPGDQIYQVVWSHTDTGVEISSISAEAATPPPPPPPGSSLGEGEPVPALTPWGMAGFIAILALAAIGILGRHRRARP